MSAELTKVEERELHQIARRINEREQTIQQLKSKTEDCASQAVTEALLQGRDLRLAKESVPHGEWQNWLTIQCPKISYRTAARYMALAAKMPHVADFSQADSLRAALLLCDMEGIGNKESSGSGAHPRFDAQAIYLVNRMSLRIVDYLKAHPLDDIVKINPVAKTTMRKDAEVMIGQLGGTVNWME